MRIALVGDIHVYRLFVPPWELASKALIGQANVWFNRRGRFDHSLLPPLLDRVASLKPDLLLFTGDLTSISTDAEFADVAALLAPTIAKIPTVIIPGNHDRYTRRAVRRRGIERAFPGIVPESFPMLRDLGNGWRLLAIDTAVPDFFSSRGRAGAGQLAVARERVRGIKPGDGLVVMAHYALDAPPSTPPIKHGHRLADADALRDLFRSHAGPVVFLHGHVHRPWCWRRTEPGLAQVIDINAGAPCQTGAAFPFGQGFWQIDLPAGAHGSNDVAAKHHVPVGNAMNWQCQSADK